MSETKTPTEGAPPTSQGYSAAFGGTLKAPKSPEEGHSAWSSRFGSCRFALGASPGAGGPPGGRPTGHRHLPTRPRGRTQAFGLCFLLHHQAGLRRCGQRHPSLPPTQHPTSLNSALASGLTWRWSFLSLARRPSAAPARLTLFPHPPPFSHPHPFLPPLCLLTLITAPPSHLGVQISGSAPSSPPPLSPGSSSPDAGRRGARAPCLRAFAPAVGCTTHPPRTHPPRQTSLLSSSPLPQKALAR